MNKSPNFHTPFISFNVVYSYKHRLAIVHQFWVRRKDSLVSNWSMLLLAVQMCHISVFSRLLWVIVESLVCHLTSAWNPKNVITLWKIVFPLQHVYWFVPSDLLSAQILFSGHTNCALAAYSNIIWKVLVIFENVCCQPSLYLSMDYCQIKFSSL